MTSVPWTYEARPDTRITNVRLGFWLFLASEALFFGSLLSAVVLLRTGAAEWLGAAAWTSVPHVLAMTALLGGVTAAARRHPLWSALGAAVFVAWTLSEYAAMLGAGLHPASHITLACWFALTGVHAAHVAGGGLVTLWVGLGARRIPAAHLAERRFALARYWGFVDLVWIVLLVTFFI